MWHPSGRTPQYSRNALDNVGLLFRCFLSFLPVARIEGAIPRSARPDGERLIRRHGVLFAHHLETYYRDPLDAHLVDFSDAMAGYWWHRLATSHTRRTLTYEPPDSYRINDLEWPGFWITEKELATAICQAVSLYSLLRHSDFADVTSWHRWLGARGLMGCPEPHG